MKSQPSALTTTSYKMLGHLALRDWSTYELAQHMTRSTRHYWPRATSKVYEEPKKLVAHGLATARREFTGRRPRTVYSISPAGRRALRRWLGEPGRQPVVEFEGAVKVLFAEQGTKTQLLRTIASVRAQAEQAREEHAALIDDLISTGGPFPGRLHVNSLVIRFMWDQTGMVIRWAEWAEAEVKTWPEDISKPSSQEKFQALIAALAHPSST